MTRVAALWDEWADEDIFGEPLAYAPGAGRPPNDRLANGLPLLVRTFLALGADLTADPDTWALTEISPYVRVDAGDLMVTVESGRRDEASLVTAGRGSLKLTNDGRFSRKNPLGPYYGQLSRNTPILVTINAGGADYAALQQFVNEWPPRWQKGSADGLDHTVTITSGGILRRLGQGSKAVHSTEYRTVKAASSLIEYWPLEDTSGATQGANAVSGGMPFTWTGTAPTIGSGGPDGSAPLWTFDTTTDAIGFVRPYSSNQWSFQMVFNMANAPTLDPTISLMPIVEILTSGGSLPRWRITLDPTNTDLIIEAFDSRDATGTRVIADTFAIDTSMFAGGSIYGHDLVITLNVYTLGIGLLGYRSFIYSPDDVGNQIYTVTNTFTSGTTGNVTSVRIPTGYATRPSWVFGHIAVFSGLWLLGVSDINGLTGYAGETAGNRLVRLCAEEGVPLVMQGSADDTEAMGAQGVKKFLDLVRECEAADGGVIYEAGWRLGYQTRQARYNAPAALQLDVAASHLEGLPEPTDDDQQLRNAWTVMRTGGSSAMVEDAASIAADGRYDDSKTINVETDDQLEPAAAWLVHLGTVDELRWPSLGTVNFSRPSAQELIDAWGALDYGARVTLAGVPDTVQPDAVDAYIEGTSQQFNQFLWRAEMNCTPGVVGDVLRLNEADGMGRQAGRIGLSQTLAADIGSGDTSLSLASSGPVMADTATWPEAANYDVIIEGERMTVTNVSGTTSPQTVTVVRAVNGVAKAHSAGAAVQLWRAGVVGR